MDIVTMEVGELISIARNLMELSTTVMEVIVENLMMKVMAVNFILVMKLVVNQTGFLMRHRSNRTAHPASLPTP